MADREAQQKLYAYGEMSNKVQQADRSKLRRSNRDGTGEVESLRGRNDVGRMGDKVSSETVDGNTDVKNKKKERPVEFQAKLERATKKRKQREETMGSAAGAGAGNKETNVVLSSGGRSILEMGALSGYQPTHAGSRASYESLLVSTTHYSHIIFYAMLSFQFISISV
jgi:pre-mRNA-splicing helicase BRR2